MRSLADGFVRPEPCARARHRRQHSIAPAQPRRPGERRAVRRRSGAALLVPSERATSGVRGVHLASDGAAYDLIPDSGGRQPASVRGRPRARRHAHPYPRRAGRVQPRGEDDGGRCPQGARAADITIDDIDYFVPHQANMRIIGAAQRQLGVPDEKCCPPSRSTPTALRPPFH